MRRLLKTEASLRRLQRSGDHSTGVDASPTSVPTSEEDVSLGQLRGQLEANRLEIENLSKEEKRLKDEVDEYQRRVNATPVREQQLASILRNYEQLKQDYADLLAKESQSQMAADLEKRQEGSSFASSIVRVCPQFHPAPTASRSVSVVQRQVSASAWHSLC